MRIRKIVFSLLLCLARISFAQFTTVTGTVVDPNGLPYAGGTVSAKLVATASPTLNGLAYTPPTQPAGMSTAGKFTMRLGDNTVLLPAASTWTFLVCSSAGTILPAGGTGPVCFTVTGVTISGSSQDISATLNAAAVALSLITGGGGGTTINPTNNFIPVRSNATTFADSPLSVNGTFVGLGQTAAAAPFHVGNSTTNNSVDSQILISRAVDSSVVGNGHAFSDSSTITRPGGTVGYNSYDCRISFSGTANYDHYACVQQGEVYNSTGTINWIYGDISAMTVSNGVVNNNAAFYVTNPVKNAPGVLSSNYGLYVEALTAGGSNNAVYTVGTTPSLFGGTVTVGANLAGVGNSLIYATNAVLYANGDHQIPLSHFFYWAAGPSFDASADGIIRMANNALNGFNRLQFGGTTASFPSIKRNGTALEARLADDSADTLIQTLAATLALSTGAIGAHTCSAAQTATLTGVLTSSVIKWSFATTPVGVTGYGDATTPFLVVTTFPTANTANVVVCNVSGASITPGAISVNLRAEL